MVFSFQGKFTEAFRGSTKLNEEKLMANNVAPFDLKQEILKLKKDFDEKYSRNVISEPSEELKTFKFMAILGQGAFGVVVAIHSL